MHSKALSASVLECLQLLSNDPAKKKCAYIFLKLEEDYDFCNDYFKKVNRKMNVKGYHNGC